MATIISTIDGIQSYYLQNLVVNPYQEANLLPLGFFKYGLLGYLAYIPLESLINFCLLSVLWVCVSILFGAIKRNGN